MQITVRLFGSLRDILAPELRGKTNLELAPDAIVQDALDTLGIEDQVIVTVNDEQTSNKQSRLQEGDQLLIFELSAGG